MQSTTSIDQVTTYNQKEVQKQMKQLPEVTELLRTTKLDLANHHNKILSLITPEQLTTMIKSVCQDTQWNRKSTTQIRQHPSYVLITQMSLDMMWYHTTKIDADYGTWTKQWVSQFEQQYWLSVDDIAGREFFTQMCTSLWWDDKFLLTKDIDNNFSDKPLVADNNLKAWKIFIEKTIKPNLAESAPSNNIKNLCESILWESYKNIYPEIENTISLLSQVYHQDISEQNIERLLQLIYQENKNYSSHRRNYTPVGQIGRLAWKDAYTSSRWLWVTKAPHWSKTNVWNQVLATYGYMKLCGVFEAINKEELWIAYSKYNLWPYSSPSTKVKLFRGQAEKMQQYATNKSRYLPDIAHAEFMYYATETDKKLYT